MNGYKISVNKFWYKEKVVKLGNPKNITRKNISSRCFTGESTGVL